MPEPMKNNTIMMSSKGIGSNKGHREQRSRHQRHSGYKRGRAPTLSKAFCQRHKDHGTDCLRQQDEPGCQRSETSNLLKKQRE